MNLHRRLFVCNRCHVLYVERRWKLLWDWNLVRKMPPVLLCVKTLYVSRLYCCNCPQTMRNLNSNYKLNLQDWHTPSIVLEIDRKDCICPYTTTAYNSWRHDVTTLPLRSISIRNSKLKSQNPKTAKKRKIVLNIRTKFYPLRVTNRLASFSNSQNDSRDPRWINPCQLHSAKSKSKYSSIHSTQLLESYCLTVC